MMNKIHTFKTQVELVYTLSLKITDELNKAIKERGKASLLLSGGSTPKPLFEYLSKCNIAWEKVNIALVDERWINKEHKDSNALLIKTYLLKNYAKEANFIAMYQEHTEAKEAQELCSALYKKDLYPFDVIVLGMGDDGHTASLFPNNIKLKEAYDENNELLCVHMKPDTAPYDRMSLTKKAILSSHNIYLHFEGSKKQEVFKKALKEEGINLMPIASILNQNKKTVEVFTHE